MKKLNRALGVSTTRRDPYSSYTLHGRRCADPYAWLERLDDAETQAWIASQEAITRAVLDAVPPRISTSFGGTPNPRSATLADRKVLVVDASRGARCTGGTAWRIALDTQKYGICCMEGLRHTTATPSA